MLSHSLTYFNNIKIYTSELYFLFFTFLLILILWSLPDIDIFINIFYILFVWIISSVFFVFNRVKYLVCLFSPNFLCFYYISLSICFGSLASHYEYGKLLNDFISDLKDVKFLKFILTFLISGLFVNVLIATRFSYNNQIYIKHHTFRNISFLPIYLIFCIFSIYFFSMFESFFSYPVKLILSISACFLLCRFNIFTRLFIYLLIIYPFSIGFSNKRELILIILLIFFTESLNNKIILKPTIKTFLYGTSMSLIVLVFIMGLSVMRGYGGFDANNIFTALLFIPEYMSSDLFLHNIADNLEVSHTFPASVLPISYIVEGKIDILAGSSLIKPFFIPFPSDIVTFKPESALRIFTYVQAKHIAIDGGSFPVPFLAETFMNFHFFGILIYLFFFLTFEKLYYSSICSNLLIDKSVFLLCALYTFVVVRGSGLDLYILHLLVPVFLYLCFLKLIIYIFNTFINFQRGVPYVSK